MGKCVTGMIVKAELSLSDGAVEKTEKSLSSTSLRQIAGLGLEGRLTEVFSFPFSFAQIWLIKAEFTIWNQARLTLQVGCFAGSSGECSRFMHAGKREHI